MTILLDTNIIMDVLQERLPFVDDALKILELGREKKITCFFTANAAADIFYIYSKARGRKAANDALSFVLNTLDVVQIGKEDCLKALALPNEDFEDSLVEVCAKKIGADYVVSRDDEFIATATEVKVVKPDELFTIIQ
ncbi:MAG: PIN domain-containing protein [Clostridiales Family XIII bacterium]|jgi:predicted nucleic acid-binding protein|nr:PIN domain-containing protein [Clostridiales Family XIII bacterium]